MLSAGLVSAGKEEEKARHVAAGKELLAKGQFADALIHLHAAIDLDPNDYQLRYRRATALLATGKSKQALPDLDEVVRLKPDFTSARVQRGSVLLKQGEIDTAEEDFKAVLQVEPNNAEASEKLQLAVNAREYANTGKAYVDGGDLNTAEWYITKAIEISQWDPSLYRLRARCLEARGEIRKAIADIRTLSKLIPDATEAFFSASKLYYSIGDVEESLGQIRECLKLNPDHKECFPYYKQVKKLAKMRESLNEFVQQEKWMECLDKGQQILKFEQSVTAIQLDVFRQTCKCNRHAGHIKEALQECTEVLEHGDPNDVDALCDRAEAFIDNEQFDEAIEDYRKAKSVNEEARRPKEGLDRAEKLKKQASKRDYYKILGVKRNANKREIMKAYRKLAQKWHPDNFSDDDEKKRAEAKFIDIASAKEVLTDEEKRRRFDLGEDPLDPEAQQHGGHNPFQHFHHFQQGGGFPFGGGEGGGPFSFKFNF